MNYEEAINKSYHSSNFCKVIARPSWENIRQGRRREKTSCKMLSGTICHQFCQDKKNYDETNSQEFAIKYEIDKQIIP